MSSGVEARKRKRTNASSNRKPMAGSKKARRINAYHSSSEDEDVQKEKSEPAQYAMPDGSTVSEDEEYLQLPNLTADHASANENTAARQSANDEDSDASDQEEQDDEEDQSEDASSESSKNDRSESANQDRKPRKRNDPSAFATSISKILDSKLTTSKRADPVLSRSKAASTASKELSESRLEAKARKKLREDKRVALEKGRVKDVLAIKTADVSTAETIELEKRLRKTAQRGVVKLFNAVRAAQVKAEQAAKDAKTEGIIGVDQRQEKVNEMSKKGFLDLLAEGGTR